MTPLDRATLADALASATAETLRADAETCLASLAHAGDDRTAARIKRLAALALAVAMMEERGFGVTAAWYGQDDPPVWFDTNTRPDENSGVNTLPAALAALLKGDQ